MHRRDTIFNDLGSLPWLSQRKYYEVFVALREQKLRSDRSKKSPMVLGVSAAELFGEVHSDCQIAIQAASRRVKRLGKPVVIQEDLSVVPEDQAMLRVLERLTPEDVV